MILKGTFTNIITTVLTLSCSHDARKDSTDSGFGVANPSFVVKMACTLLCPGVDLGFSESSF